MEREAVSVDAPMAWDPIERAWLGPTPKDVNARVTFYLELVTEGRTKSHKYQDYLPADGDVWERSPSSTSNPDPNPQPQP